jgi:hypothetical protein
MRLILLLISITFSSFSKSQELNLGSLSDDNPKIKFHFGFLEAFDESKQIDNDSTIRFIYLRSFDVPYIFLADKDSITIKKGNKLCIDCSMVDLNRLTKKEQFLLKTFSELRNHQYDSAAILRICKEFPELKDSTFIRELMVRRINKDTIPFTYSVKKVQIKESDYTKLLFMMDSLTLQNKTDDFNFYIGGNDGADWYYENKSKIGQFWSPRPSDLEAKIGLILLNYSDIEKNNIY